MVRHPVVGAVIALLFFSTSLAAAQTPTGDGPELAETDLVFVDEQPDFATSLGVGAAVGPLSLRSPLDHARSRYGYERLSPVATGALFEVNLELFRFVVQGDAQLLVDVNDFEHYQQSAAGVSLGYRLTDDGPWSVTPFVGFGLLQGRTCLAGAPSQRADPSAPPFEQVLAQPGVTTCLSGEQGMVRTALAVDYRPMLADASAAGPMVGFYVGLRLQGGFPVGSPTWSVEGLDAPSFAGPPLPVVGASVGLVLGTTFGATFER